MLTASGETALRFVFASIRSRFRYQSTPEIHVVSRPAPRFHRCSGSAG